MKVVVEIVIEFKPGIDLPKSRAVAYIDGALTRDKINTMPGVVVWNIGQVKVQES